MSNKFWYIVAFLLPMMVVIMASRALWNGGVPSFVSGETIVNSFASFPNFQEGFRSLALEMVNFAEVLRRSYWAGDLWNSFGSFFQLIGALVHAVFFPIQYAGEFIAWLANLLLFSN